jgi:hypothetical protein
MSGSGGDTQREPRETPLFLEKSSDAADDAVHSNGSREQATHLHTKPSLSTLQILDIEQRFPDVWSAIQELEPVFLICHIHGLWLQPRLYLGVNRRGTNYIDDWMRENKIQGISHKGMTILRAAAFYKRFLPYDRLLEYLKTHNWGELEPDRGKLDFYEKTNESEIKKEIQAKTQAELAEALQKVSGDSRIPPEKLLPMVVKTQHKTLGSRGCGSILTLGFKHSESNRVFSYCPKCRVVIEISASEMNR